MSGRTVFLPKCAFLTRPFIVNVILANLGVYPENCKPLHPLRRNRGSSRDPWERAGVLSLPQPSLATQPLKHRDIMMPGGHHAEMSTVLWGSWAVGPPGQAILCPWAAQRCPCMSPCIQAGSLKRPERGKPARVTRPACARAQALQRQPPPPPELCPLPSLLFRNTPEADGEMAPFTWKEMEAPRCLSPFSLIPPAVSFLADPGSHWQNLSDPSDLSGTFTPTGRSP